MDKAPKNKIAIYKPKKGEAKLRVHFDGENVWLRQKEIADLFGKDRSVITKHINQIFKDKEIDKKSNVHFLHIAKSDKPVAFYSLDVILAVGYRTNSSKAIHFRQWATKILKRYLLQGYAVNQKRLTEQRNLRLSDLERTVALFKDLIEKKQLANDETSGLLKVITDYANVWALLEKFDKKEITAGRGKIAKADIFDYSEAKNLIAKLKSKLTQKKEASQFFAVERDEGLGGIIGNVNQEIAGKPVYPTIEEKASHLLYFIIKDHVFIDGNKRVAAFLFILFLTRNNYLFNKKGERKINDSALVAITLLIAESKMQDKDIMVKLVSNLIAS